MDVFYLRELMKAKMFYHLKISKMDKILEKVVINIEMLLMFLSSLEKVCISLMSLLLVI